MALLGRLAIILASLSVAGPALAADAVQEPLPSVEPVDSGWTFTVAPYLWMAGLNGDIGLFGREPVPVDQKFGDILDDLEFAGTLVAELHNGSWGVFADVMYVKTSADSEITRTIGGVPVELNAGLDTESFTATVMGEYRVLSNERATVDLMAGARIWSVDNDISASLAAGGAPVAAFSGSDGDTWVDGIVGAKARVNLDAKWFLNGWGMIGGGGSNVTWDVLAGVGYQWNDRISTTLGYRALGVDYENDGFVYDVVQHGPVLGMIFRF
jgi:hypothetical protein